MPRNASSTPSPGPRKSPYWASHIRQLSRTSLDRQSRTRPLPQSPDTVSSQSTIRDLPSARRSRFGRRCTVTINETFTRDEVLLDPDLLGTDVKPGALMAADVLKPDADRPWQNSNSLAKPPPQERSRDTSSGSNPRAADPSRRYVFAAKAMTKDQKARHAAAEVLVAKHIADAFGIKKGSQVLLTAVDADNPAVEASHVELAFKDQYLSRSDMWRLAAMELSERTVYKGQMLLFLGTVKAQVTAVFVEGRKTHSAFFGRSTRPIFRSESARYVLFIQMAREMWDFDSDGSGEILFNKVVDGFLPALFKKWVSLRVKHLVSIILFARVEYDTGLSTELANTAMRDDYYTGVQPCAPRRPYKDFYRVVVSEMASGEWTTILHQLKREFNFFRRDISNHHQRAMSSSLPVSDDPSPEGGTASNRIKAEPSRAVHGNVLEAINMATTLFAHDYIDRDLMRTGVSTVVITPSPGVFEVDYGALQRTTESLAGNGIGIDLVCVPRIPLHSVPLFRYRNPLYHHDTSQPKQPRLLLGHGSSTPKPPTPQVGSYSSISGSSPGRAALRGDGAGGSGGGSSAPSALRAASEDEWLYALPHWLHVSYWVGTREEPLSYQGIALSVPDTPRGQYDEEFTIRCRMYDLQMRSVLQTNEIETSPLLTDPDFPSAAALRHGQAATGAGSAGIRNTKIPQTLFDHVYGFQKFTPDRHSRQGTRSLWKQLREYDEAKSRLPTSRQAQPRPVFSRDRDHRAVAAPDEGARRHAAAGDPSVLGSSFTERKASISTLDLPSVGSLTGRDERLGPLATGAPRRGSQHRSANTTPSPTKPPKVMRQISIGQRGFGIAPPKAAVAALSTETASASRSDGGGGGSGGGAPSAGATPIKNARRPTSRQTTMSMTTTASGGTSTPSSSEPFGQHTYRPDGLASAETPARPIIIGSGGRDPVGSARLKSGSRLASKLRAEPPATPATTTTIDDRDVRHSHNIRQDDEQRVLNSKLLAGALPELPSTLSAAAALSPWLTVLNPSNPDANRVDMATLYSRWQHVFPRPEEMRIMRWKTLCCPAAVPLTTEYFPTKAQFDSEYQRQPYSVSSNPEDDEEQQQHQQQQQQQQSPRPRAELLRELVGLRFSQGFQVVVGPAVARAFGQRQLKIADVLARGRAAEDGTSVFMSAGNTIHQLSCVNDSEVEVNIFVRKPTETATSATMPTTTADHLYRPAIRTLLDHDYQTSEFDALKPKPVRNWNYIDAYIAGHHDELTEDTRFWRTRFVLIPIPIVAGAAGRNPSSLPPGTHHADSEEEIHIEGIRRLTRLWLRHRHVPPEEERRLQGGHHLGPGTGSTGGRGKKKGHHHQNNPPIDIVYVTEDPSVVIAAEPESLVPLLETSTQGGPATTASLPRRSGGGGAQQLLTTGGRPRFHKKSFSVAALAEAIQQPPESGGVRVRNRRWHQRLHYGCFVGSDMTSWLLDNFEDLEDREEAEALGRTLMAADDRENEDGEKDGRGGGLFVHVDRRHTFRDGQYLYQISSDYAKPHPPGRINIGMGANRKKDLSIPSTPLSDHMPRDSPRPGGGLGLGQPPSIREESSPVSGSVTPTPTPPVPGMTTNTTTTGGGERRRVVLSRAIKYDVDHRRRSYRPEVIDLHFDRLHNPDSCYHIRMDWMNVTAKLVEDAVEGWAREAAQYGLRLVEIPIAEASTITDVNAFRRPYRIRLALPPPAQQPATYFEPGSFTPRAQPVRHFYQRAVLRRFDFVLDAEAASNFRSGGGGEDGGSGGVDVSYSWGRPDFRYTQFIHRSGTVLAEITDEGDLLLLANRLYGNRAAAVREKEVQNEMRNQEQQHQQGLPRVTAQPAIPTSSSYAPYGIAEPTPMASPAVKPAPALFSSPVMRAATATNTAATAAAAATTTTTTTTTTGGSELAGGPGGTQSRPPQLGPSPEALKDEVERFCQDSSALEALYKEVLERPPQLLHAPPNAHHYHHHHHHHHHNRPGGGGGTPSGAVAVPWSWSASAGGGGSGNHIPETSIPSLGLPPGVLTTTASAASEASGSSPRIGSPAFSLSASQLLRRGSVQEGILGLRAAGHGEGRDGRERERG